MIIAVEGLPGAGKTTSASLLAARLGAHAVRETTQGHPFLDTVYDDARRYDLQVELAFLLIHNGGYRQLRRREAVVTDFSPVKDLLFADAMLAGRDLEIFVEVYEQLYTGHPAPDRVVYLDVAPDLCLHRIRTRMERDPSRRFEAGMDLERLLQIQAVYESRLPELGKTVIRFDVNDGMTESEVVEGLMSALLPRVPGRSN